MSEKPITTRYKVRIWSAEHNAWWRAEGKGYTLQRDEAGVYDLNDAWAHIRHLGPEKKVVMEDVDVRRFEP